MALIDKLIQALNRYDGQRLTLAPGTQVLLTTKKGERPISSKKLTGKQVEDLLRDAAPADMKRAIEQDGRHTFQYSAATGPVRVRVQRSRDQLRMTIEPPGPEGGTASFSASQGFSSISDIGGEDIPVMHGYGNPAPAKSAPKATPKPAPKAPPAPFQEPEDPPKGPGLTEINFQPGRPKIDHFFLEMIEHGCSDIHLSSENSPLYRKDGEIISLSITTPFSPDDINELLMEIVPDRNRKEFAETNDTDFAYAIKGVARFRCNYFRDRKGPGAVFRVIPEKILTAEDLNLSEAILKLCRLNKGLVVVTGPTGSGKSTTLAAMIDYINRNRTDHILTIEDPIEFVHPNKSCLINQREVGLHTRGFKVALRAALREDPDIVLVGEMRDLETVAIAIETAETGHLVFGTLHTNTAASTVDRIIDQFPTAQQSQIRTMLAESLRAVIAQTLCKKIGGGRVAALEVLIINRAISNLIREGKTFQIPSMMQTGRNIGMVTLNDSLMTLVKNEVVEPYEAHYRSADKDEFKRVCERAGFSVARPDEN